MGYMYKEKKTKQKMRISVENHKVAITSTVCRSNLKILVFVEGRKPEYPEKNLEARIRTNKKIKVGAVIGRINEVVELTRFLNNKVAVLTEWQFQFTCAPRRSIATRSIIRIPAPAMQ